MMSKLGEDLLVKVEDAKTKDKMLKSIKKEQDMRDMKNEL